MIPPPTVPFLSQMQNHASHLRSWVFHKLTDPDRVDTGVIQRLSARWATSTWKSRRTVANLASQVVRLDLPTLFGEYPELATVSFLEGLEEKLSTSSVMLSTAKKYTTTFLGLLKHIPGVPHADLDLLRDYASALVRQGANIPTHVAIPIDRTLVRRLVWDSSLDLSLRACMFVVWKTASRWGDVIGLHLPLRYFPQKRQILVPFLAETKTSKEHPFEPRFLCVIDWSFPGGLAIPEDVLEYLTTRVGKITYTWTTEVTESFLRTLPVSYDRRPLLDHQTFLTHLTCHSFKKGAVKHLWSVSQQENLSFKLIERISKHKNPSGEPLSQEAVQYAPDLYPVAIALETHLASRLL